MRLPRKTTTSVLTAIAATTAVAATATAAIGGGDGTPEAATQTVTSSPSPTQTVTPTPTQTPTQTPTAKPAPTRAHVHKAPVRKKRSSRSTTRRSLGTTSYSTNDGLNWSALARCESGGDPRAVSSTGKYRGLYQFSMETWHSVGGSGDPIDASSAEQTRRAQILYNRSGRGQWPECGRYL